MKAIAAARDRATKSAVSRTAPYVPPYLLAGATYTAACGAHQAWSASPGPAVGLALVGAALTYGTAATAPKGAPLWRVQATVTAGLAAAGVTSGTFIDPTAPGAVSAWVIFGLAAPISWTVRRLLRNGGAGGDAGRELTAGPDLFAAVRGLKGTRVAAITPVSGHQLQADLALPAGEVTVADVQRHTEEIAQVLHVPAHAVKVRRDPDSAARAVMTVTPRDPLAGPVPWSGPSAPGGCVSLPIVHALRADGTPSRFWLPGDPKVGRNLSHLMFSGVTGAGKGETFAMITVELATRRRVVQWVADPAKGVQTLQDIAGAFDWIALGETDAKAMIASLPAVITARADALGRWGYKQWVPEVFDRHGMPLLYVQIEEATRVLPGNKHWVKASQEARSAGVVLGVSAQVMDHETIPRKTRGQFGTALVHGQAESIDVGYVLPDAAEDAGADPLKWANRQPGMHYLIAPGIPPEDWDAEYRTFYEPDAGAVRHVIAAHASTRAKLDPVTAGAAGRAYRDRPGSVTLVSSALAFTEEQTVDTEPDTTYDELDNPVPVVLALVGDEDELGDVDPDEPIPAGDTPPVRIAPPADRDRLSTEAARRILARLLQAHEDAGADTVHPRDFYADLPELTRTRGWLYTELTRLATAGHLTETADPATYRMPVLVDA